ncbi:hypothetical protein HYR99_27200 [Candidatus Poribacteria bacterium]|nr:hypothetical protein [Candidatus Poribacteria bacterium]
MNENTHYDDPLENPRRGHERSDANMRPIVLFGAGLVVLAIVVLLLTRWVFGTFATQRAKLDVPPSPLADTREPFPGPRLQVTPVQDVKAMRAAEDTALNRYGWVDKEGGLVRIPIDRAIEVLATRGLPVRRPGDKGRGRQGEGKMGK